MAKTADGGQLRQTATGAAAAQAQQERKVIGSSIGMAERSLITTLHFEVGAHSSPVLQRPFPTPPTHGSACFPGCPAGCGCRVHCRAPARRRQRQILLCVGGGPAERPRRAGVGMLWESCFARLRRRPAGGGRYLRRTARTKPVILSGRHCPAAALAAGRTRSCPTRRQRFLRAPHVCLLLSPSSLPPPPPLSLTAADTVQCSDCRSAMISTRSTACGRSGPRTGGAAGGWGLVGGPFLFCRQPCFAAHSPCPRRLPRCSGGPAFDKSQVSDLLNDMNK